MKFIVAAPEYREDSGGILVLHYLAHLLAIEGHDSIIAAKSTFPESKARLKYWEMDSNQPDFCDGTEMVIYPEVITNNPLHASHVTRWLLHKEGFHTGKAIEYGNNNLIFQYASFCEPLSRKPHGILKIQWIRTDIFQNKHQRRRLFGFIVRKGKSKGPYKLKTRRHPPKSLPLDASLSGELHEAATAFNKVRIIVCYDPATFWTICASLCGCFVIIIPTKGINKNQFHRELPFFKCGIAYGFFDILRALRTRSRIYETVNDEYQANLSSVKNYVEVVSSYFTEKSTLGVLP